MVVVEMKEMKEPFTVLRPEEFLENNRTVPEYIDRSDDVAWMLGCSLILLTIQTGIGLMESGMCSLKNEVHGMMKNLASNCLGGLAFWAFGWGLSMGRSSYSTSFFGFGEFLYEPDWLNMEDAERAVTFFYHLSLCALNTSLVSGAMAERVNFKTFLVYSVFNVTIYAIPASWLFSQDGWLKQLGGIDYGCGVVHLVGGFSALVVTMYLGPRTGQQHNTETVVMGNPTFCLAGLFITWWGYLAMNSASTFGVEGTRWLQSAKATAQTLLNTFGGAGVGLVLCYCFYGHIIPVGKMVNCTMGSLVSNTAITFLCTAPEAIVIGGISGFITFCSTCILDSKPSLDDPCCTFITHGLCGIWGMLAVGIFAKEDDISLGFTFNKYPGIIYGGGYLLGIQALAVVCLILWSLASTYVLLRSIDFFLPFRAGIVEELLGADLMEHNILHKGIGVTETLDTLARFHDVSASDQPTDPQWSYFQEQFNEGEAGEVDLEALALMLGVEKVTKKELKNFKRSLKNVEPREVEGFGFGKLHGN